VVAILIAIVVIFYLRQRSRGPSAVSTGVGAALPERPLSDGGTFVSSSLPVSPVAMKFYVRVFVPWVAFCVSLSSYFCTPRTRMIRLRSRSLLISEVEPPWPTRSPKTWDITPSPLFDLIHRSHRRSPVLILGWTALLLVIPSSISLFFSPGCKC
jgi:hypothetical protein